MASAGETHEWLRENHLVSVYAYTGHRGWETTFSRISDKNNWASIRCELGRDFTETSRGRLVQDAIVQFVSRSGTSQTCPCLGICFPQKVIAETTSAKWMGFIPMDRRKKKKAAKKLQELNALEKALGEHDVDHDVHSIGDGFPRPDRGTRDGGAVVQLSSERLPKTYLV